MNSDRLHILIIGCGGREHAIVKALSKSKFNPRLFCFGTYRNPGIYALVDAYATGKSLTDVVEIVKITDKFKIDFAIVGGEVPLEQGVVDKLEEICAVPCIGPYQSLARIETSKEYCRKILKKYGLNHLNPQWEVWKCDTPKGVYFDPKSPKSKVMTEAHYQELKSRQFSTIENDIRQFVNQLNGQFVIKCDGLKGGKGVSVSGDHFENINEGMEICKQLYNNRERFIIEEKLIGEEFSLFSLCDGKSFVHCPIIKDYKRARDGDKGLNTGGMGSFSMADHKMPFLTSDDVKIAQQANERVTRGLMADNGGIPYIGVIYGSFMKLSDKKDKTLPQSSNIKVIEYNARLGDPEGINLLELMDTDFVDVCLNMISHNLHELSVKFKNAASKCVYVVPKGYPKNFSQNFAVQSKMLNHIVKWTDDKTSHLDLIISGIDHKFDINQYAQHSGNVYIEDIITMGTGNCGFTYGTVGAKMVEHFGLT